MILALQLLLLLVAARLLGRLSTLLGQPPAFGEMLAGALLAIGIGLTATPPLALSELAHSPDVALVAEIGIFFLLLLTGIEMKPEEILEHSRESFWVALGGAVLPFAAGFGFAWLVLPDSGYKLAQAMIVGTGLAITAIPVAAEVLRELGLLHRPTGEVIIAAAIFDDVLGLILLAVTTAVIGTGNFPSIPEFALLLLKVATFFAIAVALGRYALPAIWRRAIKVRARGIRLTTMLATAIGFSLLALVFDMHHVLGAFIAGLFFSPVVAGEAAYGRLKQLVETATFGFLAPIFFAWIGLQFSVAVFGEIPLVVAALIIIAMLGKIVGAGLPAVWAGMSRRDALAVGVGMTGRGAVELVVLSVALNAGVFAADGDHPVVANLFSALVVTAVVTTLAMPLLLRWVLRGKASPS